MFNLTPLTPMSCSKCSAITSPTATDTQVFCSKCSAITSPTATDTHALQYLPVNERPSTASANTSTFYKICFLPTVEMAPLHTVPQRFGSEDERNEILPLEPQQIFTLQRTFTDKVVDERSVNMLFKI